jgi:hypothetical protein
VPFAKQGHAEKLDDFWLSDEDAADLLGKLLA